MLNDRKPTNHLRKSAARMKTLVGAHLQICCSTFSQVVCAHVTGSACRDRSLYMALPNTVFSIARVRRDQTTLTCHLPDNRFLFLYPRNGLLLCRSRYLPRLLRALRHRFLRARSNLGRGEGAHSPGAPLPTSPAPAQQSGKGRLRKRMCPLVNMLTL
jgi:hypothetical protein